MTRPPFPRDPMSHDREPDDWSRYARHLAGESTADEIERTRRALAGDPARAREADEASSAWHALAPAVDAAAARRAAVVAETDAAWARLTERAAATGAMATPPPRRRWQRPTTLGAGLAAAAAVAFAVVRARDAEPSWRTYATAPGQRASVHLPDGSRADLRAGTTIRVAIGARRGARVVELTGEAVFAVTHDAARPFRVVTRGAVTEDLGTVFAVRAYAGDSAVRVVVAEGAVSLGRRGAGTRPATLSPGDVATLDAAGTVTVTRADDPTAYFAWTRDRLVVRGERLADVVADLERAYGVRVAVPDSTLAARRVTLDMPARTLAATLETLATLLGAEVRRTGDALVLRMPDAARGAAPDVDAR